MKRYEPFRPRFALATAALVMTASTLGVTIVLPSVFEADAPAIASPVAASKVTRPVRNAPTATVPMTAATRPKAAAHRTSATPQPAFFPSRTPT